MIGDTELTLAFDTSSPEIVVALGRGATLIGQRSYEGRGQQLLPMVVELLSETKITLDQLERIAVGVGPGSFTGTRVGVTTARGLAASLGIDIAPMSTLAAIAQPLAAETGETVWASADARRGERFAQSFRWISGFAGFTMVAESPLHVVANSDVAELIGDQPHVSDVITPSALLHLASDGPFLSIAEITPIYGREPDAKPAVVTQ